MNILENEWLCTGHAVPDESTGFLFEEGQAMQKTARAMVLVHGGEIKSGVNLAVEAATICHASGNNRFLERIYGIQQYLDRLTREAGQASTVLREALDGSVEY
jgi:hypothetical protein